MAGHIVDISNLKKKGGYLKFKHEFGGDFNSFSFSFRKSRQETGRRGSDRTVNLHNLHVLFSHVTVGQCCPVMASSPFGGVLLFPDLMFPFLWM